MREKLRCSTRDYGANLENDVFALILLKKGSVMDELLVVFGGDLVVVVGALPHQDATEKKTMISPPPPLVAGLSIEATIVAVQAPRAALKRESDAGAAPAGPWWGFRGRGPDRGDR